MQCSFKLKQCCCARADIPFSVQLAAVFVKYTKLRLFFIYVVLLQLTLAKQCSSSQFSALIPLKSFGPEGFSLQNILDQAEMSQSDAIHHLLYSDPCYAQAGSATQTFKCFTILLLLGAILYCCNQNVRSKRAVSIHNRNRSYSLQLPFNKKTLQSHILHLK